MLAKGEQSSCIVTIPKEVLSHWLRNLAAVVGECPAPFSRSTHDIAELSANSTRRKAICVCVE